MTEGEKTYEVTTNKGRMRFTVPATFKVSYGAIVPGTKTAYTEGGAYGLRVWESTDKQRMVLSGVTSFRDVAIPIVVEAVRKFGDPEDAWYFDDGTYTGEKAKQVHKDWRPIDEVREGKPSLSKSAPEEEPDGWDVRSLASSRRMKP